jgi:hypothetical protein
MEWSCALYRAVQDQGISQADTAALVEVVILDAEMPTLWWGRLVATSAAH